MSSMEEDGDDARSSPPPMVLNIPRINVCPTPSTPVMEESNDQSQSSVTTTNNDQEMETDDNTSIGEFDDGKTGKLTLSTLIHEGLIEPGEGVMTIDYLGQTFKGDLMAAGKIKSQETGLVFNNPSAWAIYCKKIVNPAKKSGCGWASVKYKGRKMDHFKTVWTKIKTQREEMEKKEKEADTKDFEHPQQLQHQTQPDVASNENSTSCGTMNSSATGNMIIVKHSHLAPKTAPVENPREILVAVESFPSHAKVQPFTVSVSSSALLLIDLHIHMSAFPAKGYLAGHWDLNSHNLAITHVYPFLQDPGAETEESLKVELDIYNAIYSKHLTLAGWYGSNPKAPRALPSLTDVESQLDYQVKLLGNTDASYTPCVGLITKPFASLRNDSDMLFYWVVPPPENSPQDYGKPMKMCHTIVNDPCLSQEVLHGIDSIISFHQDNPKLAVRLEENFNTDILMVTKMGRSLLPKFPRDQDDRLWRYIRMKVLGSKDVDLPDPLIATATNGKLNGHHAGNNNNHHHHTTDSSQEEEIDDVEEEEEIDDDEENAIRKRRGYRSSSSNSGVTITSTNSAQRLQQQQQRQKIMSEEIISMLLQKQAPVAPVAPMAHGASSNSGPQKEEDEEAPLDFSAKSK